MFIYKITHPSSDKIYIGKTGNIKKRMYGHIHKSTYHNNKLYCWMRSILNKGLRPQIEAICEVPDNEWQQHEIYWISFYRSKYGEDRVLNHTSGGEDPPTIKGNIPWNKGIPMKDSIKKKLSKKLKGRTFSKEHKRKIGLKSKGRKLSSSAKEKISKANKGKIRTLEQRKQMSKSHKGKKTWNAGLTYKGKYKASMSEGQKKRALQNKPTQEQIEQILKLYGEIPRTEIFKHVNVSRRNVAEVLRGKPNIMSKTSRAKMSGAKRGRSLKT